MLKGPYDIGLVEGSITTHHDAERIQQVRRQCRKLITIGACATAGGIQALRNWQDVDEFVRVVYATPQYISTLKLSTPIAEHVPVDFELRGCPINKHQLIELISATLAGRKPNVPTYSVCMECKRRGNVCIAVAQGVPCLGPVTHAGCGAICPSLQPRMLRLLRTDGEPEHRVPHAASFEFWARTTSRSRGPFAASTPGRGSFARRARNANDHERCPSQDPHHQGRLSRARRRRRRPVRQAQRRSGDRRQAQDLRAAPPVRGLSARPPPLRSSGHRGAHLRHLSHRLPDERRARHRARPGCRPSIRQYGSCADSSTAASGSKATPCTSSCSTRPIFSAIRMRSRWLATIAAWSSRACA